MPAMHTNSSTRGLARDDGCACSTANHAANLRIDTDADVDVEVGLGDTPECFFDDEQAICLQRLRSAVAELSQAVAKALDHQRGAAEACMHRAIGFLQKAPEAPRAETTPARCTVLAPWQIRRVAAHIESNLDSPIRNVDLASALRLSTCHFNHAFRNSFGQAPHEYLTRRRIEHAQGLMLATDAPLSQIAADCGLADQSHFNRLFRKLVGDSPGSWRKARVSPSPAGTGHAVASQATHGIGS